MLKLEKMIQYVLDDEGRVVSFDPDDPGRRTAFGISHRYNPQWEGWNLIADGDYNQREIENLAIKFYENLYSRCGAKFLPSEVRYPFFDAVVNLGSVTAVKILQRAMNTYVNVDDWVKVDGIIGIKTIKAIRTIEAKSFISVYSLERINYYRRKVEENPKKKKYLFGWICRTLKVCDRNREI